MMTNERMKRIVLTPTVTAGAYSANDVMGGLLEFPMPHNSSGFVRSVQITTDDGETMACKLHLYVSAPTAFADNAAHAPTINDLRNRFAQISIAAADYVTINGNAQATVSTNTSLDFEVTNQNAVFGYLVADATPTFAATTDLTVTVTFYLL
jgi:hypothetical protein